MPGVSVGTPLLWAGFLVFVVAMLALDLGVLHRRAREVTLRAAAAWSAVWVGLAAGFNVLVWHWFGRERALEFTAGYLLEKALAVDNIFVIAVILAAFGIPAALHHRVLFWGIVGALVLRGAFIFGGSALLERFHWTIYVFGALLAVTGIRLLRAGHEEPDPERNVVVRLVRRFVPVTAGLRGDHFTVVENGRRYATPLLLALVTVELTDVIFAIDSIPAVFAVTRDPFIVFTSNIFAILGLRAMFFLLAGMVHRFHYLKTGLAVMLLVVGAKLALSPLVKVPVLVSLGVIVAILAVAIVASLLRPRPGPAPDGAPEPDGA
jgi:tellurite resistance protein TerC